jgi:hypothetical protein
MYTVQAHHILTHIYSITPKYTHMHLLTQFNLHCASTPHTDAREAHATHTHVSQTRTHTCIHTLMQNTGVIGARPPKEHSTSSHEQTLARVLEYVAMAGGLEAALTDDVAREEV